MNWFAITIIGIWMSAALGTLFSKDSQCMGAAMIVTIFMGMGYFILKLICPH
jgi:hypothetical protein